MNIPFIDFTRDKKELKKIKRAIDSVVKSGNYILGERVKSFEKQFSKFTGHKYAIGVNSGTDGLTIVLKSLSIKRIALSAASPLPCIQAILNAGKKPVFIDAKDYSGQIDIEELKKSIDKIDAVIIVHLYGIPENKETIDYIKKNKKIIIEDCSQSIDTYIGKYHTGHFGVASVFSFYPTKNLGAIGDGGIIVTNNKDLYNYFLMMRNYGIEKNYIGKIKGMNSRLDEIQAAVLLEKLKSLKKKNKKRKQIAYYYNKHINNPHILTLPDKLIEKSNCHIYPIFSGYRDQLKEYLYKHNVNTKIHYTPPIHKHNLINYKKKLKIAESISNMELSLPIFPELTDMEIRKIVKLLNHFYNN